HPSAGTVYPMLAAIAQEANVQEKVMTKLFREIGNKLGDRNVLLIVDEAQHLDTKALEQLRSLHDQFGIGLAVMGNATVLGRILGGGKGDDFAQLFSRVGFKVSQKGPKGDDACRLLAAWDITDKEQLKFLKAIAQKPGALRVMNKTLQLASIMAAQDPNGLRMEHIRAAYAQIDIPASAG
ncbi:MAG TPA: DNA transposition protein, partial [Rhodospirillaceae bacterium]|nr:DNA transposition protein [Rhodospirillaceae bacterium]